MVSGSVSGPTLQFHVPGVVVPEVKREMYNGSKRKLGRIWRIAKGEVSVLVENR